MESNLSGPKVALGLERHFSFCNETRPCIRVRVLPFHPRIATGFIPTYKKCGCFFLSVKASLLAPLMPAKASTGVTCYLPTQRVVNARTFLPDFRFTERRSCFP